MLRKHLAVIAIAAVVALAGCGGGGGGGDGGGASSAAPPPAPVAFTAVALAGELLTYTLDTTSLTYSYLITDSMYGLNGKGGSGTLTRNADGSYSPSDIPNAKVVVLPNGLLLGAIRESINGALTTIPIIGMSAPVTTIAAAAGTYNYVQRSCLNRSCNSSYGTFILNADATWTSCPSGNLVTGCAGATNNGTVNSLGGGKWQVLQAATEIGTGIVFSSGGQNVVVLDLKDTRPGGFAVGILIGSSQQPITAAQSDGTWIAGATNGDWGTFIASGSNIAYQTVNGMPSTATSTLTFNSPWTGFGTSSAGGNGILAGSGVYAYQNVGGYAVIGLKIK